MSPVAPFTLLLDTALLIAEIYRRPDTAIANFLISHVNHIYFLEFVRRDKRKSKTEGSFPSLHLVPKLLILNPGIT